MDPSRIGPFALEERLPGAESTFRAVHVAKRKTVALKVFPLALGVNPAAAAEYIDECERLNRLRHPRIARSFGGGIVDQFAYLASEIVTGESLAESLRQGSLPWQTAVTYAKEIASALVVAHEQGIFHELLIPEKIMIDEHGLPRILDFRIQRHLGSTFVTRKPRTAESASGLAPEFSPGSTLATPKVDLYALGVLMFRMLTSHLPCPGRSVEELLEAHRQQNPPRVATLVFDCPIWLDAVIAQLLQKNPLTRTHSAAALVMALEETERRVAEGISVTEQMTRGISAVRLQAQRSDAQRLLGHVAEERDLEEEKKPPLLERAWFLATCLAVVLCVGSVGIYFAARPLNADQMMDRAAQLLASEDRDSGQRAKTDYLLPLLERFPDSHHAAAARQQIDKIDMDLAENRLRLKIKFGREPQTEVERLYIDAWNCEQFGDRITALEKYQGIVDLMEGDSDARVYFNLARRQIARIESDESTIDRSAFLQSRLQTADELMEQGSTLEARKIWSSIVKLYKGNQEMERFVEIAQDRLAGKKDRS